MNSRLASSPRFTSILSTLFALASGVLWGLCFGRDTFPFASWIALAPLVLLLGTRRPGWFGWLHGTAAWVTSLWWLVATLETYGQIPAVVALLVLLLLAAFLALYHGVFAALGARCGRRGTPLALVALPALWVALEWLRTFLLSGFPWNLAGYAWDSVPGALPLAAWLGAYGVSYLLVFANTGIALAVAQRRLGPAAAGLLLPLLLLGLAGRWGSGLQTEAGRGIPVRILQPNIQNQVQWDPQRARNDYRKVMRMAQEACDEPGALVVWPESAAWPLTLERDLDLRRDVEELGARGCGVILNSVHRAADTDNAYYNSVYLVSGTVAQAPRYDKRHLVPYGEYAPLRDVLPFVGKLARNAGDFSPAREVRLLPWRDEQLGLAICFEVIFPGEVAEVVRAGATVLVTVTNDAWYGDTAAPWQHFRAARFRAAESRRPLVRAAITGVSGFVAPDGSLGAVLGPNREGILRASVDGRGGRGDLSPYDRAPWLLPLCSVLLAGFAIFKP